jgi:hypothetical protein
LARTGIRYAILPPRPFDTIKAPEFVKAIIGSSGYIFKIDRLSYWDSANKTEAEISEAIPRIFRGLNPNGESVEFSFWRINSEHLFNAACAAFDRIRGGHGEKVPLIWFTAADLNAAGIAPKPLREGDCLLVAPQHIQIFLSYSEAHALLERLRVDDRAAKSAPAALIKELLKEQDRVRCRAITDTGCLCEAA